MNPISRHPTSPGSSHVRGCKDQSLSRIFGEGVRVTDYCNERVTERKHLDW